MTTDTKYNGWTNYETWNCVLWIDNSGDESYWSEAALECFNEAETDDTFTRSENASFALADRLKDSYEAAALEWMRDQASFFADMLNASLSAVNWQEIASHYVNEAEQDEAA